MTKAEARQIAKIIVDAIDELRLQITPPVEYKFTAEEKAKQLGISVSRLYKVKDRYPYRKESGKRRIMFA